MAEICHASVCSGMSMNALSEEASEGGDSPTDSVAPISRRRSFPLGLLMVCFTAWLIATEVLVFDEIKFNANAQLLEQTTRALKGSQLLVPTEPPSSLPGDAKMDKL
jgi:hypothetical protein